MSQRDLLREQPGLHSTNERLSSLLESMQVEAEELCRTTDGERSVRGQQLERRANYLRSVLGSPVIVQPAKLQGEIAFLERWTVPPPRPVDEDVDSHLEGSDTDRLNNRLDDALQKIDRAKDDADGRDLELALVYQWRGRVLTPKAKYREALEAYRKAADHADAAAYDDARLEAELLAAEIAVMRLGDLEEARESLDRSDILLRRLREPWLSPRWANYHEISAAVLKRESDLDEALVHQTYALLVRGWWKDEVEIAMGYINLGTIYELRGDSSDVERAQRNYELAVKTLEPLRSLPEWYQATFNLGHWLVFNGGKDQWARAEKLLEEIKGNSDDAWPSALSDLVILELQRRDAARAVARARELEALLRSDALKSLSAERRLDAWQNITSAHALAGDLTEFERARNEFGHVAQEMIANATPQQADAVKQQTAELDLTAADDLAEKAPDRAIALASSARDYLVQRLSEKSLSEESKEHLLAMLDYAGELLAKLSPSIPSTDHP